jgi:hypothetical protein
MEPGRLPAAARGLRSWLLGTNRWSGRSVACLLLTSTLVFPARSFVIKEVIPWLFSLHLLGNYFPSDHYRPDSNVNWLMDTSPYLALALVVGGLTWGWGSLLAWPTTMLPAVPSALLVDEVTPNLSFGYPVLNAASYLLLPGLCTLIPLLLALALMKRIGVSSARQPRPGSFSGNA